MFCKLSVLIAFCKLFITLSWALNELSVKNKTVAKMELKLTDLSIILLLVEFVFCEVLQIEDGTIEGIFMEDRLGEKFNAFLAIPFAEPPVNDLRFKAPLPVKPWLNILKCTDYGPMCAQPADKTSFNATFISEDCLHLNVFSKDISLTSVELKPVIAFFHGGGFESGLEFRRTKN